MPVLLVTRDSCRVEAFVRGRGEEAAGVNSLVAREGGGEEEDDDDCWMFSGTSLEAKLASFVTNVPKESLLEIYMWYDEIESEIQTALIAALKGRGEGRCILVVYGMENGRRAETEEGSEHVTRRAKIWRFLQHLGRMREVSSIRLDRFTTTRERLISPPEAKEENSSQQDNSPRDGNTLDNNEETTSANVRRDENGTSNMEITEEDVESSQDARIPILATWWGGTLEYGNSRYRGFEMEENFYLSPATLVKPEVIGTAAARPASSTTTTQSVPVDAENVIVGKENGNKPVTPHEARDDDTDRKPNARPATHHLPSMRISHVVPFKTFAESVDAHLLDPHRACRASCGANEIYAATSTLLRELFERKLVAYLVPSAAVAVPHSSQATTRRSSSSSSSTSPHCDIKCLVLMTDERGRAFVRVMESGGKLRTLLGDLSYAM